MKNVREKGEGILIRKDVLLVYLFWGLITLGKGLGMRSADELFRYITYAALIFAGIKILFTRYRRSELYFYILFNGLGLINFLITNSYTLILTTVTLTALKNIELSGLLKFTLWIRGVCFVGVTTAAILGLTDKEISYRYEKNTVVTRYALGYENPNSTQFTLFIIVVLIILLYGEKLKLRHYLLLAVYNLLINQYTDSRTGNAMVLGILGATFIVTKIKQPVINRLLCKLAEHVFSLVFVGSFALSFLWRYIPALRSAGTFASRFRTAEHVIRQNMIPLFGTSGIKTDLGMVNILYTNGLIFLILMLIGYRYLFKNADVQQKYLLALVCIFYAIYCFGEAYMDSVLMNITLLYFSEMIPGAEVRTGKQMEQTDENMIEEET